MYWSQYHCHKQQHSSKLSNYSFN